MLLTNSKNCVACDDGVGDRRALDQLLLRDLCAEVAAFGQAFGSDDRQRDVMADAGGCFGVEEVAGRRFEELEHCRVLERRGVRHVDDDRSACEGVGESLTGQSCSTPVSGEAGTAS